MALRRFFGSLRQTFGYTSTDSTDSAEAENSENLLGRLNKFGSLFSVTALIHGKSDATTSTSNKRRISAVPESTGAASTAAKYKRRKLKNDKIADTTAVKGAPDLSRRNFQIKHWKKEDFLNFLESAEDDVVKIKEAPGPVDNLLERAFQGDDEVLARENEAEVSSHLSHRMREVTLGLRPAGIGRFNWNGGFGGISLPGCDNAIDRSFCRTVTDVVIPPVGVEVKVPWNYPGGRVTSGDVDAGRLGRDVSLVDLVNAKGPIESVADFKVSGSAGRDDDELDVSEAQEDNNEHRPQVQGNSDSKGSDENGKYEMKHDVFPPRQLVSYMLSAGIKYGLLTTGYRVDFCELHTEKKDEHNDNDDDEVILRIAGPCWTVGGLNPLVAKLLHKKDQDEWTERDQLMATSKAFSPKYYGETGVRKFGEEKPMCFFRRNVGNDVDPSNKLEKWSTDIDKYSCNEGLLRFLLAGTSVMEDSNGKSPKHTVKLPRWYRRYVRAGIPRGRPDLGFLPDGEVKTSEEKNEGAEEEVGEGESDESYYLEESVDGIKVSGRTEFGPLTLADLQDPKRYGELLQPHGRLEEDAIQIGFGRNGPAFRKTVRGRDLVCKQLAGIGCVFEDIEEQLLNLAHEMCCYIKLTEVQGDAVPHFLFAGSLVDNRFWVCPERGHCFGLATTWEGESLDRKAGVQQVRQLFSRGTAQESSLGSYLLPILKDQLGKIHACGILHNDLELRNIVCDGKKLAFVDFDAAVILKVTQMTKIRKSLRLKGSKAW